MSDGQTEACEANGPFGMIPIEEQTLQLQLQNILQRLMRLETDILEIQRRLARNDG